MTNQIETVKLDFPETQYFKEVHKKTQLVLHYSAGWDNARGMFESWKADTARVATAYGIDNTGTIYQAFDPKYWASHVGYYIKRADGSVLPGNQKAYDLCPGTDNRLTNLSIETRTVGVEVCNWGGLVLKNGKFLAWPSKSLNPAFKSDVVVDPGSVIHYPNKHRGFEYYEKYTDKEIEALRKFIVYHCELFNIPCKFDTTKFDLNPDAIKGVPGVYTHTNYRADKGDLHPAPNLIEMLKSL